MIDMVLDRAKRSHRPEGSLLLEFRNRAKSGVSLRPLALGKTAMAVSLASFALWPASPVIAAPVSVCAGVNLPPSAVSGILTPVFGLLSPLLGLVLGGTLTDIASGTPITLQAVDTNGNPISNTAFCAAAASSYQLSTSAGISFGGNQISGIGNGVVATAGDINAIAIGNGAMTTNAALQAIALGANATGFGIGSLAIGANATANNAGDVALGAGSTTQAAVATTGAILRGTSYSFAGASPLSTISIGTPGAERTISNLAAGRITATSTDAVNGSQLNATNSALDSLVTGSLGIKYFHINSALADSAAGGLNGVAVGPLASAAGTDSIAIGNTASAISASSAAIGSNAVASLGAQVGYAGYGLSAPQNSVGEVSIGAPGAVRKLTNLAAGSAASDAVNVGQLNQVGQNTASALGGGAAYNATSGVYSAPSYIVGGTAYNDLGSALGAQSNLVQAQGSNVAGLFGPGFSYNNATGAVSGALDYDGASYNSIQSAFDAINTAVQANKIKYFKVNSALGDVVATGVNAIAVGAASNAWGDNSLAVGTTAQALSAQAIAVGNGAIAQGGMATSIGAANVATGNGAVAVGDPNNATGTGSVAVGADNTATGQGAVAIGNLNVANGQGAVALGNNSQANAAGSVALGDTATANATNGVALGSGSTATNAGDVALGANSVTSAVTASTGTTLAGTSYSFAGSSPIGAVSVGSAGNERQIQNVAAGRLSTTSTDAVNGSQLYATNQAVDALSSTVSSINNGGGIKYFHANSTGADSAANGANSIAIGPSATTGAGATNAVAIGNGSQANNAGSMALGANSVASNANDVALGTGSVSSSANGGWAGTTIFNTTIASNTLDANAVVAISGGGVNRQIQGVADGSVTSNSTDAVNGSQLYYAIQALSSSTSAPVAGDNSNNLAGPNVTAGRNGLAVGYGAISSGQNSVALGNGSDDGGRANVVSVGSTGAARQVVNVAAGTQATDAANISQLQPLVAALGGGAVINTTTGTVTGPTYMVGGRAYNDVDSAISATNRLGVQYVADANGNPTNQVVLTGANNGRAVTVSNVAAGVNATDAVNVGQLQSTTQAATDPLWKGLGSLAGTVADNQAEARRGIAGATAVANLPFVSIPGMWSPAMSYGSFKGESAMAVGVQYNTQGQYNVRLRASASYVPASGDIAFGGGVGVAF